jgi:hypothetical protein
VEGWEAFRDAGIPLSVVVEDPTPAAPRSSEWTFPRRGWRPARDGRAQFTHVATGVPLQIAVADCGTSLELTNLVIPPGTTTYEANVPIRRSKPVRIVIHGRHAAYWGAAADVELWGSGHRDPVGLGQTTLDRRGLGVCSVRQDLMTDEIWIAVRSPCESHLFQATASEVASGRVERDVRKQPFRAAARTVYPDGMPAPWVGASVFISRPWLLNARTEDLGRIEFSAYVSPPEPAMLLVEGSDSPVALPAGRTVTVSR